MQWRTSWNLRVWLIRARAGPVGQRLCSGETGVEVMGSWTCLRHWELAGQDRMDALDSRVRSTDVLREDLVCD